MKIRSERLIHLYAFAGIFLVFSFIGAYQVLEEGFSVIERQKAMTSSLQGRREDTESLAKVTNVFDSEFKPIALMEGAPSYYKFDKEYLQPGEESQDLVRTQPNLLQRVGSPEFVTVNNTNIGVEKSVFVSTNGGSKYRIDSDSFTSLYQALALYDERADIEFSGLRVGLDVESQRPTAWLSDFTLYLRGDE